MTWNYRIISREVHHPAEDDYTETLYAIHEVYYDKDGKITAWTEAPVTLDAFAGVEDIRSSLELIKASLAEPVLILSELLSAMEKTNEA